MAAIWRMRVRWLSTDAKDTARQARIKELKDQLKRGYFDDVKDFKDSKGKKFLGSAELRPANNAVALPSIKGITLSGKNVDLKDLVQSKTTLVTLGLRDSSNAMIETYSGPFLSKFQHDANTACYQVSSIEGWFLPLFRSMIVSNLRKIIPKERHDYFISNYEDVPKLKKSLEIHNSVIGYVFLLDSVGRIRWRAHSFADPVEIERMLAHTQSLITQNR